jgi:hypothetical protein
MILVINGHSTHMTLRVITLCEARKIMLIKHAAYSSQLAQPLDLCVFSLFKMNYRKETQTKGVKGEIRKIYRILLVFYKSRIIPMVRWSFKGVGCCLNPDDLLKRLRVDPTPALDPDAPDLPFDDAFIYPEQLDPRQLQRS